MNYKRLLILVVVAFVCMLLPIHISRASVESHIEMVTVKAGDTIWHLAAKYSSDSEDIRDKIAVIRQLNSLDKNLLIYPGQVLQIPVSI